MLVVLLVTRSSVCAMDDTKGYLLVAHHENPVITVDRDFIEQVFLVQQARWSDGVPIDVVLNDSVKTAEKFYHDIIRKTPSQYLIYRKKLLFNGTAIPPKSLTGDEEVIRYVAQHANSLGFISPLSLDWRVKSLSIEQPEGRQ